MQVTKTEIEDVLIIEPRVFGDHRGWFTETFSKKAFKEKGIQIDFVQDNHSFSAQKGTLRGLHFQKNPKSQAKLIRCTKGKILDVAVDLRRGSATYKQWIAVELSEDNKKQILVPKGFAHAFLALTGDVEVQYKVDEYYAPECDRSIRFDDPEIGIEWGIDAPILSEKDLNAPLLKDSDAEFSIKVLVTGANGQLGYDLAKSLKKRHIDVVESTRKDFDITDKENTKEFVLRANPDVIIHCAAYTAVDQAEDEKELCYSVNVDGTRNVAEAAKEVNAKLVYVSTDYVFDGTGKDPYPENKNTNPVNYYGYTKEQGEKIVRELIDKYFIVRTSWLYGSNGTNFVKTMMRLTETRREISVVSDQVGAPTYTKDLANFITDLIQTDKFGVYHGVNEGYCSWYEFAKAIFEKTKTQITTNPVETSGYPTKAKRPLNSRLSKDNTDKAGVERLAHWDEALSRFLEELKSREGK